MSLSTSSLVLPRHHPPPTPCVCHGWYQTVATSLPHHPTTTNGVPDRARDRHVLSPGKFFSFFYVLLTFLHPFSHGRHRPTTTARLETRQTRLAPFFSLINWQQTAGLDTSSLGNTTNVAPNDHKRRPETHLVPPVFFFYRYLLYTNLHLHRLRVNRSTQQRQNGPEKPHVCLFLFVTN